MTISRSKTQVLTLEEYLAYDDGTETGYELDNGILVEMPTENPLNATIAMFLAIYFASQLGVSPYCLAIGHQIQVPAEKQTARQPDLIVHSEASAAAVLADGKLLRLGQPVPRLVVEVVSNSDVDRRSRDRDYLHKRKEYARRGIPEYWIIDPAAALVAVLTLAECQYAERRFADSEAIASASFPQLKLTAAQILAGGRSA